MRCSIWIRRPHPKRTRLLLERLQDEGRIIELYDDLPRAAVLCENALGETLYLTQLSPQAIQRRARERLCCLKNLRIANGKLRMSLSLRDD